MSDKNLEKFLNLVESNEELRRRISTKRFDGDMGNIKSVCQFIVDLGAEDGFKFTFEEARACSRGGPKAEDGTREVQMNTQK